MIRDCQDKFENDKSVFLSLLEKHIDIDEITLISFRNHFYASVGRPRKYPLKDLLWALIIQRIFLYSHRPASFKFSCLFKIIM